METNNGKEQVVDKQIEIKSSDTESPATNDTKSENRLLSDGLLIAAFTALSYIGAYCFELGYAAYFNLPRELIRVSLDMCLRAAAGIFSFIFVLVLFNYLLITSCGRCYPSDTNRYH